MPAPAGPMKALKASLDPSATGPDGRPVPPIERFGPVLVLVAGVCIVLAGAFGVIPGGSMAAGLAALTGLGGYYIRHQAGQ